MDNPSLDSLKQSLEILRYEASQRGDHRHELLACVGLTNLALAEMQAEAVHSLHAIYARLPWESGTSTDWTTPREEARRNREARRTA